MNASRRDLGRFRLQVVSATRGKTRAGDLKWTLKLKPIDYASGCPKEVTLVLSFGGGLPFANRALDAMRFRDDELGDGPSYLTAKAFIGKTLTGDVSETVRDGRTFFDVEPVLVEGTEETDQQKSTRERPPTLAEVIEQMLKKRSEPEDASRRLATGLPTLDKMTGGGLRPGGLVISAGAPGIGKTSLAVQIATKASVDGWAVLYVSIEPSAEEIAGRVLSPRLNVHWSQVIEEASPDAVRTALQSLSGACLHIDDRALDAQGEAYVRVKTFRETCAAPQPLLVVVDYLQRIAATSSNRDHSRVGEAAYELREAAKDFDAVVLALSSVNRASYRGDGAPMAAFKESGDIEFGADVALLLQNESGTCEVQVVKNRLGGKGEFKIDFDGRLGVIIEPEPNRRAMRISNRKGWPPGGRA